MFGLRNELFGFPVNNCDYEGIDCKKQYTPVLNWDEDNDFTWSLVDPFEGNFDASNITFAGNIQLWENPNIRVDAALDLLKAEIKEVAGKTSNVNSFSMIPSNDGESVVATINYTNDLGETYDKEATINIKSLIEGFESLSLKAVTAESLVVNNNAEVKNKLTAKTVDSENLNVTEKAVMQKAEVIETFESKGNAYLNNASIETTLLVKGDSTLKGLVTAEDNLDVKKNVTVEENLNVLGTEVVDGNSTVKGDSTVEGILEVKDCANIDKNLNVKGSTELNGILHVSKSATIDKELTVRGNADVEVMRSGKVVSDEVSVSKKLILSPNAEAPDFVMQVEKGEPNGIPTLNGNGRIPLNQLPDLGVFGYRISVGNGTFKNSDTCSIADETITPASYVNISNYQEIEGDLQETIWSEGGGLTVVSNATETGSFRYLVVTPPTDCDL